MKSEHRHELKTNELQRLTSELAQKVQPYTNYLLIGLVALSLVTAGLIWWIRSAGGAASAGWARLGSAGNAEEFANVADEYQGRNVGHWARLLEAEAYLQTGIQLAFTDRPAARSDLELAQKSFEKLLEARSLPSELRDRALFGLARTLETLCDGDTSAAIAAYERVQKEVETPAYADFYRQKATERIEALKKGKSQEFYAWFHQQNPKPEDRTEPLDGAAEDADSGPEIPAGTGEAGDPAATGETTEDSASHTAAPQEETSTEGSQSDAEAAPAGATKSAEPSIEAEADATDPVAPQ